MRSLQVYVRLASNMVRFRQGLRAYLGQRQFVLKSLYRLVTSASFEIKTVFGFELFVA